MGSLTGQPLKVSISCRLRPSCLAAPAMGTIMVGQSVDRCSRLLEYTFTNAFQSSSSRFARPTDDVYRFNKGILFLMLAVEGL